MTANSAVDDTRPSGVLFLLAVSVFINYLDGGNLSIAAPLLKNEFHLSATQLGVLLSSFFWTYSFFLPVSGSLVDRLDVKWVLAVSHRFAGMDREKPPSRDTARIPPFHFLDVPDCYLGYLVTSALPRQGD